MRWLASPKVPVQLALPSLPHWKGQNFALIWDKHLAYYVKHPKEKGTAIASTSRSKKWERMVGRRYHLQGQ